MGFFKSFVRAAAIGGTVGKVAGDINAKQNKVIKLNERGRQLMESYNYEEALNCFLAAERLAPNEPAIKNNIRLCREALNMMENHNNSLQNDSLSFSDKLGGLNLNVPEDIKVDLMKMNEGNMIGGLFFNIPKSYEAVYSTIVLNKNGPIWVKAFENKNEGNLITVYVLYLNGLTNMRLFLNEMGGYKKTINGQSVQIKPGKGGIDCIYGLEGNFIVLILGAKENQMKDIISTNHLTN